MERLMYWFQPAPVAPQVQATGISIEAGPSEGGPWTLATYVASIRPTNYWCEQRGSSGPGDCYFTRLQVPDRVTHARARATAQTLDGSTLYSVYSQPVALPEHNSSLALVALSLCLLALSLLHNSRRK